MFVAVSTPSRIHFGLLRVRACDGRGFGGMGVMIDRPRVQLTLAVADRWRVTGPGAARARECAQRVVGAMQGSLSKPAFEIRIATAVPSHRGLGGGTQLALAVAAGVRELAGLPRGTAADLADAAGRGARSAVGSHGFVHGGLVWETGRSAGDSLAALDARVEVPAEWRIVLAAPRRRRGLSGGAECAAFEQLSEVPLAVTARLEQLAEDRVLPAARRAAIHDFGEAVYEYGRISGACFASVQGGSYASGDVAACVAAIRRLGLSGVGQSSWGPTVFAFAENQAIADDVVARLRAQHSYANWKLRVAAADNSGAIIERHGTLLEPPVRVSDVTK